MAKHPARHSEASCGLSGGKAAASSRAMQKDDNLQVLNVGCLIGKEKLAVDI